MIMKAASPAMYDNSKIFTEYLRKRRVVDIASGLGIQIKKTHTIVPKASFSIYRASKVS